MNTKRTRAVEPWMKTRWNTLDCAAPIWKNTPIEVLEKLDTDTLKAFVHASECISCGYRNVDIDHIKTRGSGGKDEAHNIWPLCRGCHTLRHSQGLQRFTADRPWTAKKLKDLGWEIEIVLGKFRLSHPKHQGGKV